jgi:hypothetical protein
MKTKAQKREEAEIRRQEYEKLSPEEKLAKILAQPGKSKRQLERLKRDMGKKNHAKKGK